MVMETDSHQERNMTLTEILSKFACNLHFSDLDATVVEHAKMCFLDLLGSAIAGHNHEYVKKLLPLAVDAGGKKESTIIGFPKKASSLWATFINGAMAHVCETDDGHKGGKIHPGATVIPPALALGESLCMSGRDFIESIIVGYEVGCRVAEAVGPEHYQIWHTTATCGTFGAAAACGKLLKLSVNECTDALGNSGSQAAGLWQFNEEGKMTKILHTAKAGFNGLLAALAAKNGFTGPKKILEGKKGFFQAMSQNPQPDKIFLGLGKNFKILENTFKIDASCGHTHPSIDALLKGKEKYSLVPEDIIEIKVSTYPTAIEVAGQIDPQTPYEAKFSIPFCLAVVLTYGNADINKFNPEILFDKKIRSLMGKISLSPNPLLDGLSPDDPKSRNSHLEIVAKQGKLFVESCSRKGSPENPLSQEDVKKKFAGLVEGIISQSKTTDLICMIEDLDQLKDLGKLTAKVSRLGSNLISREAENRNFVLKGKERS
jgi:2-methylcitrate dehydratase PrpD